MSRWDWMLLLSQLQLPRPVAVAGCLALARSHKVGPMHPPAPAWLHHRVLSTRPLPPPARTAPPRHTGKNIWMLIKIFPLLRCWPGPGRTGCGITCTAAATAWAACHCHWSRDRAPPMGGRGGGQAANQRAGSCNTGV